VHKYEKLILLLIVLILLGRFAGFFRDVYLANTYGTGTIPFHIEKFWSQISIVFASAVNIGAAIWIYIETKGTELKPWIWALLGLFFGIMGLALFYLIQLFRIKVET